MRLVSAIGISLVTLLLSGQAFGIGGEFVSGAASQAKDLDLFIQGCPAHVLRNFSTDQSCSLIDTAILGSVGNRYFGSAKYSRELDASTVQDVVVIELVGNGQGKAIWYDSVETEYESVESIEIIAHPKGALLDIRYCVNGTGGCSQTTFISKGSEWEALKKDETWAALEKGVPSGWTLTTAKGPPIDFRSMRYQWAMFGPRDPNCCPSGEIDLELDIVNNALSVKAHHLILPSPESVTPGTPLPERTPDEGKSPSETHDG